MLRKETIEFLHYWPQKESQDPKVQEICKKYESRNPAQIYSRVVKYANSMFDDLYNIFQNLPEEYLNQVNLERGLRYLNIEKNQQPLARNLRLRAALAQTTAGLHILKEVVNDYKHLKNLLEPKFNEMGTISELLYAISTGEITTKKPKETRSRRTRTRNEFTRKDI